MTWPDERKVQAAGWTAETERSGNGFQVLEINAESGENLGHLNMCT